MKHCTSCARPLTPPGERVADHPGTKKPGGLGKCSTCYQRERFLPRDPEPVGNAAKTFTGACDRCGITTGERRHKLCRDCRSVLTLDECRVWAA